MDLHMNQVWNLSVHVKLKLLYINSFWWNLQPWWRFWGYFRRNKFEAFWCIHQFLFFVSRFYSLLILNNMWNQDSRLWFKINQVKAKTNYSQRSLKCLKVHFYSDSRRSSAPHHTHPHSSVPVSGRFLSKRLLSPSIETFKWQRVMCTHNKHGFFP